MKKVETQLLSHNDVQLENEKNIKFIPTVKVK